ncbi:MAG TPA: alpha/beta hydrolase-fold protein, partial [Bacteroidota bacterium]
EVQMEMVNDSTWTFRFRAPEGALVEFKITRGSWDTQAMVDEREIPDNIRFIAREETLIVVRPVTWKDLAFRRGEGVTGTVKLHTGVKGENLRYKRDVSVWLPPSYDRESSKRYAVLYMHDGQNVFDPSTSFTGYDWHVDEAADSLIRSGSIEEIIVVAVNNSPDRAAEYSDSELGRAYASFVIKELKPMIDRTYRTKPDAANTSVMGSSMGGLISFLFVWWHPEVFSKAGCLSSAFSFDGDRILDEVEDYTGPKKDIRVYMDCGTVELEAHLKPGSDRMAELLGAKGYREGVEWTYVVDEGAVHNERAWAGRVWRPLVFLFGTKSQ